MHLKYDLCTSHYGLLIAPLGRLWLHLPFETSAPWYCFASLTSKASHNSASVWLNTLAQTILELQKLWPRTKKAMMSRFLDATATSHHSEAREKLRAALQCWRRRCDHKSGRASHSLTPHLPLPSFSLYCSLPGPLRDGTFKSH